MFSIMFLIDFAEFNVSRYLPKIPKNKSARDTAAKLLKNARNWERGLGEATNLKRVKKLPLPKGRPSLDSIYNVSPHVLTTIGKSLPSYDSKVDIPNFKTDGLRRIEPDVKDKITQLRSVINGDIIKYNDKKNRLPLKKHKMRDLNSAKNLVQDSFTYIDKDGVKVVRSRQKALDKHLNKVKSKNRLKSLANETWEDKDYRNAMNAIYADRFSRNQPQPGKNLMDYI